MSKWYHPFGLLLLASMVGGLNGCTSTRDWLARKPAKKAGDEEVAAADKKSSAKKPKSAKSAKELADAKAANGKNQVPTRKSGAKAVDEEHEKYTAAERSKKTRADAVASKDDVKQVSATTNAQKPKQKVAPPETDDASDSDAPKKGVAGNGSQSATSGSKPADDFNVFEEDSTTSGKNVVQVKKDGADELSDWDTTPTAAKSKPVRSANVAESFENELESPFALRAAAKEQPKAEPAQVEPAKEAVAKSDWDLDLPDGSAESKQKAETAKETSQGLAALCPEADGELRELLSSMNPDDPESLKQGLHRIGQMNGEGAAAAPLLRKMVKHDDAFVRAHAVLAMVRLGIVAPESVAIVTDSLKSRDASLRSFAAAVLAEMGPQTGEVLMSLSESLKDRDGQIRIRAAEVLIQNEEFAYPALQALLTCLKDKDDNVRWLASYSLAELAPQSPEAVQALMKAVRDPVPKVSAGAAYALGEIGPYAKRSAPELRRAMESAKDDDVKNAIAYSLQQIEKDAP